MEKALRDLIAKNSKEEFRGVYLESGLNPTRKSILAPGSIGVYSAGNNYNPAQILRDESVAPFTDKIDKALSAIVDQRYAEMPIEQMKALIGWIRPDEGRSEHVWSAAAIAASFDQFGKIHSQTTGYVYVDRNRDLEAARRETAGILAGGEFARVPNDKLALYMLRTKKSGVSNSAWWPQVRFPDGLDGPFLAHRIQL